MVMNSKPFIAPPLCSCIVESTLPEFSTITGAGFYREGASVTVEASPAKLAVFDGWQIDGEIVNADPTYTFTITSDTHVMAVFSRLWVISSSVSPDGAGEVYGTGIYVNGDTVTLDAYPEERYLFDKWRVNNLPVCEDETYTFTAEKDILVNANFVVKRTVTIFVNLDGAGEPTGGGDYPIGSSVTVLATVKEGYEFVGWYDNDGNLLTKKKTYHLVLNNDIELMAAYEVCTDLLQIEVLEECQGDKTNFSGYIRVAGVDVSPVDMECEILEGYK